MAAVSFLDPYEKNRRVPLRLFGQLAVLILFVGMLALVVWLARWAWSAIG